MYIYKYIFVCVCVCLCVYVDIPIFKDIYVMCIYVCIYK